MAVRQNKVEYFDANVRGKIVKTLDAKLYAPDGSIFKMPYGGDATTYLAKGYKLAPDAEWNEKHEEYNKAQEQSLKVSNAQRELQNKRAENEVRAKMLADLAEMKQIEQAADAEKARLDALEAELNGAEAAAEESLKQSKPAPAKRGAKPAKAKP